MADDMGEKTEAPTGRRLSEARGKGQVAKSQDLAAAIDLIGSVLLLVMFGGALIRTAATVMRQVLTNPSESLNAKDMGAMAPILALLVVAAAISQVVQVGLLFTLQPLQPNLNKLNPAAGFGRLFNKRNLVKTILNTVKLAVVLAVAYAFLKNKLAIVAG